MEVFILIALWAFAEAALFFIVADVPISYTALRYGWRKAVISCVVAACASAIGGLSLLMWVRANPDQVASIITALPAIDNDMLSKAKTAFASNGYTAMITGSFSGIPYKLYAYAAAGPAPIGLAGFACASFLVRLPRFLCVTLLVTSIDKMIKRRVSLQGRLIILATFWIIFYSWYFTNAYR